MSYTKVKVIADSLNPANPASRITTFEVFFPRIILAEVNTHRVIAKNYSSYRAVPTAKAIERVENTPFIPASFGRNQPGMTANEELSLEEQNEARKIWIKSLFSTINAVEDLNKLKAHKQHINRLLEPFSYIHGVLTATEWDNFFTLRTASNAQPEFQELASLIQAEYKKSTPVKSLYHLPYTDDMPSEMSKDNLIRTSVAHCARVSYTYNYGKIFDLNRDIARFNTLLAEKHMSPFDHVAIADTLITKNNASHWKHPEDHLQFWGWIPLRRDIERNNPARRSSFEPVKS